MEFAATRHAKIRRPCDVSLAQMKEEDRTWQKFKDLEEDDSSASESTLRYGMRGADNVEKGKGRADKSRKRKRASDDEDESGRELSANLKPRNMKSREKYKGKGKEERDDDERSEEYDEEHRKIHYRPQNQYAAVSYATGELHDAKCSNCRLSGKMCEKQRSGSACVNCRRFKHRCEFVKPRKVVKSKPEVESEDEDEIEGSPAPPSRHPRMASEAARRRIKKAVAASNVPKPRSKRSRLSGKLYFFIFYIFLYINNI
jgi:hypothetical protein